MRQRKPAKKNRLNRTNRRRVESLEERKVLATMSVAAAPPTVDGADIAMLNSAGQFDPGGNEGHIWNNRPVQGQSFTTGSDPNGYTLTSFTLQNEENTNGGNTATFTGRIGSVSGNTFNPIRVETSNNSIAYDTTNSYITFTFDNPVDLLPNTTYGFDLATTGAGFTTWANDNSNYGGGEGYSTGANGSPDDANLIFRNVDRIFHLNIAVDAPNVNAMDDDYSGTPTNEDTALDVSNAANGVLANDSAGFSGNQQLQ